MKTLKVQVADTPHKLERGLMFVNDMPDDEGMLFVFPRASNLTFWGKNTFIPLDIAFLDEKYKIVRIGHIQPMSLEGVRSEKTCRYAIEANYGYFAMTGIRVGDFVEIEPGVTPTEATVRFVRAHNNEGLSPDSRKDNTKQGQVVLPPQQPATPVVDKPEPGQVGEPIGVQPQMSQLPVLTKQDIGSILEDSFDDETPDEVQQPGEEPGAQPGEEGQEEEPQEQEFPDFATAQQAVQWAEDNLEVVHISYTTKKGRQLERDVEPHGQFHSESTKRQILVTFDESVGAIRAFIVSNIGSWRFVGKKFAKKFVVKG